MKIKYSPVLLKIIGENPDDFIQNDRKL